MAKLTKNLAPLFDSSISYEPGERFMYGDHMYEALEPLSGAFDSTKVSEVTLADIFKGVSSNDVKCLAPEYDVNTEYSVENLVLHDGVLYECVETTTGPFDETKWSRKYLSDVGGLNSNFKKKYKIFTLNRTTTNLTVECGFRPSIIFIGNNTQSLLYNVEKSSENQYVYGNGSSTPTEYNCPYGTNTLGLISEITDTGFSIGISVSNGNYVNGIAFK